MVTVAGLPIDVQYAIVANLTGDAAANLALSCRTLRTVVRDAPAWQPRSRKLLCLSAKTSLTMPAEGYLPLFRAVEQINQMNTIRHGSLPDCEAMIEASQRSSRYIERRFPGVFTNLVDRVLMASLKAWKHNAPRGARAAYGAAAESIQKCKRGREATLSLTGLPIETLPAAVFWLKDVRDIRLCGTLLTELPSGVGCLVGLKALYLSRTPVKNLPESIGLLQHLVHLSVARTQVREFPKAVASLRRLREVQACHTPLKKIPQALLTLTTLKILSLPASMQVSVGACQIACEITFV